MNKKAGIIGWGIIILLLIIIIELVFCLYTIYHCFLGNCTPPHFFGIGKYMAIPTRLFFSGINATTG